MMQPLQLHQEQARRVEAGECHRLAPLDLARPLRLVVALAQAEPPAPATRRPRSRRSETTIGGRPAGLQAATREQRGEQQDDVGALSDRETTPKRCSLWNRAAATTIDPAGRRWQAHSRADRDGGHTRGYPIGPNSTPTAVDQRPSPCGDSRGPAPGAAG